MRRPTIYDVAERAGVSKSLVSLVLRDSPKVSAEKREAVLAAISELDYTPSRLAAGLAGTRTRSVGVVIDDFSNLWFVDALAGLRASLGREGYALSVADAHLNAHLGVDPIDAFRALRVDGLVLAGEASGDAVQRAGVPAVVLGIRAVGAADVPVIASDEVAGGRIATRHLVELGHRTIACISGPGASAAARETGYREAMADAGLAPSIVHADVNEERAARAAASALFGVGSGSGSGEALPRAGFREAPTAVFAVNDPMAVGAIAAARAAGLAVPSRVSVVGYDDSPLAAYGIVSLTTISGDPRELGERAGEALLALLADGSRGPATSGGDAGAVAEDDAGVERACGRSADEVTGSPVGSRTFAPRLVVRGSTAPCAPSPRPV
ncbi:LacI family DNA-binding transcriptional regulator [Leucobacter chromiiresistens]|uniref:DNA-binding transcriptional regulator, LacI/PurR family n=1 Tax=Leucobacter chromiiresistens TaxID=1079994 RepID=A0A1H0Y6L0_9MICO|nr:LacI family DNA-binding transcriptional regulator [Leucobacter chromiiresistens]SDQ10808.1 DNA-binding transcriptional regulator, LacI/PurR family [Leucobacter chromiiresistens]